MDFPAISHHGGARSVTGSCYQLQLQLRDDSSLLIDCGLEQGWRFRLFARAISSASPSMAFWRGSSLTFISIMLVVSRCCFLLASLDRSCVVSLRQDCCRWCWRTLIVCRSGMSLRRWRDTSNSSSSSSSHFRSDAGTQSSNRWMSNAAYVCELPAIHFCARWCRRSGQMSLCLKVPTATACIRIGVSAASQAA